MALIILPGNLKNHVDVVVIGRLVTHGLELVHARNFFQYL